MRVIAKSGGGWLVEMTEAEICLAAGYSSTYDAGWRKVSRKEYSSDEAKLIGVTLNVNAAYDFHTRIRQHEAKAIEAAGTLRALASLLDGALPTVAIPPAEDAPKPEDATNG